MLQLATAITRKRWFFFKRAHLRIAWSGITSHSLQRLSDHLVGKLGQNSRLQINSRKFILLLVDVVLAISATTQAETTPKELLPQLLEGRFGKLTVAEQRLADATLNGATADCSELPAAERIIRGELLSWLCTNPNASAQITYRGISIAGAEIVRQLDLEWARISFPITVFQCVFRDPIILDHSHMFFLNLEGSSVSAFRANTALFEADLFLRSGFKAEGGVGLTDAKINGNLDCAGGQFKTNEKTPALSSRRLY